MPLLDVGECEVHFETHGQAGPFLTLVHGGWLDARAWDQHVDVLSRSFRVVTLDLRGYGRSGQLDVRWSVAGWAGDIVSVWNAVGVDTSYVLGFSMGGPIALEVAVAEPGRISGLILVSTTARFGDSARAVFRQGAQQFTDENYDEALERHVTVAFSREYARCHPDELAVYRERARQTSRQSVQVTMGVLAEVDYEGALPGIFAPTLVIHGTGDQVTGGDHPATLLRHLPNAREFEVPGGGHTLHLEQPVLFVQAIADFVAEAESQRPPRS